jgi:N,N'-diacetylchitobiose transport system substrate-binding protein
VYRVALVIAAFAAGLIALAQLGGRSAEVAELEYWTYGTGGADNPTGAFWQAIGRDFGEVTGRSVAVVSDIPHGPYMSVLTTRFVGGNPPDALLLDDVYVGQLAQEGLLVPLDPFIEADPAYESENYPESMVRDSHVDARRFSIPWYGGSSVIYYRTDLFAQAGVEPPETWEELITVGRTLQQELDLEYPFAFNPRTPFMIMPWIWQAGADILSDDARTVLIDSPESIYALEFIRDLMYVHGVMDPAMARGAQPQDAWSKGAAAFIIDGSWNIGRYNTLFPQWQGKWNVALLPAGRERVYFYGGSHLAISADARDPELAWDFLSYAASREGQTLYAEMTGYPPGNLEVYKNPGFADEYPKYHLMPATMKYGRNNPLVPFFGRIWYDTFGSQVLDVVMPNPEADISAAVGAASQDMQEVVDDYWEVNPHFLQGHPEMYEAAE